ncbi:MAG: hypothetical protein QOF48_2439, partial [Verrucomicrobiota bacterium]
MATESLLLKKPAPTYYGIIAFKLIKGGLFFLLAWMMWALSDNDLPAEVKNLMQILKVNPANKFFTQLAEKVGDLTEAKVLWAAAGTLVYSLFSLVEGGGLIYRVSWAGWLAIGESAFFIPIEIYELNRRGKFSWWLLGLLIVNIVIVWYLFTNRHRLFRHHHHPRVQTEN